MANPLNAYIVGGGKAYITPGKTDDTRTVTLKIGDNYCKLREVEIKSAPEDIKKVEKLKPGHWVFVGQGDNRIALNKRSISQSFEQAARKMAGPFFNADATENLKKELFSNFLTEGSSVEPIAPESMLLDEAQKTQNVFLGITPLLQFMTVTPTKQRTIGDVLKELHMAGHKITMIQNLEGNMEVVAIKPLSKEKEGEGEGSYKIARVGRVLFSEQTFSLETVEALKAVKIIAKIKKGESPEEAIKEAKLSKLLVEAGIPYTLQFYQTNRPEKDGQPRFSLESELCRGGSLTKHIESHFQGTTIKPEFIEQHTIWAYQIIQAILGMHENNVCHCDLKTGNVLLKEISKDVFEVRVIDFGLTEVLGEKITYAPGTFPPPEANDDLDRQQETFLSSNVDAWAFGIVLYSLMHNRSDIVNLFNWSTSGGVKRAALIDLVKTLVPGNPIDTVISKLLDPDPSKRIPLSQAKVELENILGPNHPEVIKARERESSYSMKVTPTPSKRTPISSRGKSVESHPPVHLKSAAEQSQDAEATRKARRENEAQRRRNEARTQLKQGRF